MKTYNVVFINLNSVEKTVEISADNKEKASEIFEREFFMKFKRICHITEIGAPLRCAAVTYANGEVITTSLAAHLTDDQIKDYFKIGKKFNIGNVTDNLQEVRSVEIIR